MFYNTLIGHFKVYICLKMQQNNLEIEGKMPS